MKTIKPILIFVLLATVLQSCKNEKQIEVFGIKTKKHYTQLEKAKWLVGNWENLSKKSNLREIWTRKNDSTLTAKSFVTVGKDTVFYEEVAIIEQNDSLFYNVTIKGQNNNKPVPFYMTKADEKEMVFENPKHDFPTKITYTKITNDSLVATVSGLQNGKENSESFPMKKSN